MDLKSGTKCRAGTPFLSVSALVSPFSRSKSESKKEKTYVLVGWVLDQATKEEHCFTFVLLKGQYLNYFIGITFISLPALAFLTFGSLIIKTSDSERFFSDALP